MADITKKLDRFTAAILAEATAENERVMADLRAKRKAAYDKAEDQSLLEAYHYIRGEVSRIKSEAGRRISRHMLDNKRTLYLRREAIAQEVFAMVRQRIQDYTGTPVYLQRLKALLAQALDVLPGAQDVRVLLRDADMVYADALRSAAGRPVTFDKGSFVMGGLIAESASLGRQADASFDSAMADLSGHFAELFGLSLADEDELTVRTDV